MCTGDMLMANVAAEKGPHSQGWWTPPRTVPGKRQSNSSCERLMQRSKCMPGNSCKVNASQRFVGAIFGAVKLSGWWYNSTQPRFLFQVPDTGVGAHFLMPDGKLETDPPSPFVYCHTYIILSPYMLWLYSQGGAVASIVSMKESNITPG